MRFTSKSPFFCHPEVLGEESNFPWPIDVPHHNVTRLEITKRRDELLHCLCVLTLGVKELCMAAVKFEDFRRRTRGGGRVCHTNGSSVKVLLDKESYFLSDWLFPEGKDCPGRSEYEGSSSMISPSPGGGQIRRGQEAKAAHCAAAGGKEEVKGDKAVGYIVHIDRVSLRLWIK